MRVHHSLGFSGRRRRSRGSRGGGGFCDGLCVLRALRQARRGAEGLAARVHGVVEVGQPVEADRRRADVEREDDDDLDVGRELVPGPERRPQRAEPLAREGAVARDPGADDGAHLARELAGRGAVARPADALVEAARDRALLALHRHDGVEKQQLHDAAERRGDERGQVALVGPGPGRDAQRRGDEREQAHEGREALLAAPLDDVELGQVRRDRRQRRAEAHERVEDEAPGHERSAHA